MDFDTMQESVYKEMRAKAAAETRKAELEAEKAEVELETARMTQRYMQSCIDKDKNPLAN